MLGKILVTLATTTILLSGCGGGSSSDSSTDTGSSSLKRYQYESGRILYDMNSSVTIGTATVESRGSESLVFRNWGNEEVEKSERETTTTITNSQGGTSTGVETDRELDKWLTPKSYSVNYEKEHITVIDYSDLIELAESNPDSLGQIFGGSVVGLEKTGTDEVLGYTCDVYKVGELGSQCLHQGILLKSTIGGMTHTATSIEFNIDISDSELALPNYPHNEF